MKELANIGIVCGGVLPYLPQYIYIFKSGDASGFSSVVCLLLLVANTTRICFYFRQPFETSLLLQSIVMIIAQLKMLEIVVRKGRKQDKLVRIYQCRGFWKWTSYVDYLIAYLLLSLVQIILTLLFPNSYSYTQLIGVFALGIEASLGLPQLHKNYKRKATAGVSYAMVFGWTIGDVFKTVYAVQTLSPLQFLLCGAMQIAVDVGLMYQVVYYFPKQKTRKVHVRYAQLGKPQTRRSSIL
ncbi:PQ-loop repeat-containing protein 1-like [Thraustotheca clavata]|uniref:PQ-loop repeat-containing protein 1-like n=1 Tax=Thraustotheca clavata TaxID=74557 RepID=A0A1W0ABH1_9STRA|nr:PQ-loop repeat-containing protein 1-like [Thraustotheca clavata]